MSHNRLKQMKENLMTCIEAQMCNIYDADAEELGEAIDMLKDLEEALYYCTITEAMEGKKQGNEYEFEMKHEGKETSQMYNRGGYYPMYARDMGNRNGSTVSSSSETMMRDPREGRSPENRKMYLEAKHNGVDKNMQLKELDKYIQELTNDVVEMIQEASIEEKQYLEKKIAGLASRIGQMK